MPEANLAVSIETRAGSDRLLALKSFADSETQARSAITAGSDSKGDSGADEDGLGTGLDEAVVAATLDDDAAGVTLGLLLPEQAARADAPTTATLTATVARIRPPSRFTQNL